MPMSRYVYLSSSWKYDKIVIATLNVSNRLSSYNIKKFREKLLHYKKILIVIKIEDEIFSRREKHMLFFEFFGSWFTCFNRQFFIC